MTDLTLFFAPDTCARVSMIALEETEHPYKTELIAFMKGDHSSPRYLELNPKSKVLDRKRSDPSMASRSISRGKSSAAVSRRL